MGLGAAEFWQIAGRAGNSSKTKAILRNIVFSMANAG
jgi:hypothetical protein